MVAGFGFTTFRAASFSSFRGECSMAERQILRDTINVGRPENLRFPQRPSPFRPFALEQMASAGAPEKHFAGAGYLETFAHRLFGLNAFGTSHTGSFIWRAFECSRAQDGLKEVVSTMISSRSPVNRLN